MFVLFAAFTLKSSEGFKIMIVYSFPRYEQAV